MKQRSQFLLLGSRRFLPLFITQFLGAFHDNVFKNAFVVMLLFDTATKVSNPEMLTTLAAGVFILPFVIFSALGGQLADKYPKEKVILWIKVVEFFIALLGCAAILSGSVTISFITLFILGTHSAFFSPSKYAILPQHLHDEELIGGNALVNTGTFLAIIMGTMAGTILITLPHGKMLVCGLLIISAISGYFSSRWIRIAPAQAPDLKLNFNPITETISILRQTFSQSRRAVLCLLGIAWFWFLGSVFMSQLPNFTKNILHADEHVLSLFLILFSLGIAGGGLLNNRLLKGRLEGVYVPIAMLGITIFSFDLYFAGGPASPITEPLKSFTDFTSTFSGWRIIFDILMIAICGGLFVVPLNAILQHLTNEDVRARVLAGSAILDALMMVASSIISALLIGFGFTISQLFLTFSLANAAVALYICRILPDYLFKSLLQILFKFLYRVEIRGLENLDLAGPRAVIVSNHVSLLDPPLLAAFLPGRPMFAVNKFVADWWWVKPFLRLVDAFPLDPSNPFSLKDLIRKVEENRHIVIFPEGRLTDTGALMKIYDGPGMIADKTGAMILPIRLDGVQHTAFARLKGKVPIKSFPKITITILPPRYFKIDDALKGRGRRTAASRQLFDLMEEMMFITGDREQTLFQGLLKARAVNGGNAIIAEDAEFKPLQFDRLIKGAIGLGSQLKRITSKGDNVGLMLPNSIGAIITFFALQAYGRVPAMLNYSSGVAAMLSACRTAKIKTVITSRRFVELGRLEHIIQQLSTKVKIIYLEDVRKKISFFDMIVVNAERLHRGQYIKAQDPAVILFTSGSEGEPKAVALSHINIMTNIVQLSSRVDFNRQDIVFNCLPMFHSFGLTGGTLLPIISGIRTFLYPTPLHYKIIPELIYTTNATIMFGTDTFLQGYGRKANSYDFYRMRYIFAGAEKVKDSTRQLYREKFNTQILEGYGATETAPVIAVNSAMQRQDGSVGRLLPGIEYRLEAVPGIDEGKRLYIRGPNVMLGYYLPSSPGILTPPANGWHDTGDMITIDAEGFMKIVGRLKRFAKIGGEMVSLGQIEDIAAILWPQGQHAAVAISDTRKGERIVLVTTQNPCIREDMTNYIADRGMSLLVMPASIIVVPKIPLLSTGKTDYVAVKKFVMQP
jgi:acyl-[acyl-carrier-protein]-phospholipid O-acyltransferase / long-chain-fatty-acid--[acyl-carrier-protein] ligase